VITVTLILKQHSRAKNFSKHYSNELVNFFFTN